MKPEIKAKWVEALRSGEYTQTHGVLKDTNDGMCCLGVLCDVYHKETGNGGWNAQDTQEETIRDMNGGKEKVTAVGFDLPNPDHSNPYTFPVRAVVEWAGGKTLENGLAWADLACENDSGKTFAQIADMIETVA